MGWGLLLGKPEPAKFGTFHFCVSSYIRIILKLEDNQAMSRRMRFVLLTVGLLLLLLALAALSFALQPDSALRETIRLSPTLFVPPGASP